MSYTYCLRAAAVGLVCLLSAAAAAAPVTLTYEGDLVANGGGPAQGEHKVEFALYTTSAGGAAIWTEVHPDVLVVDGHFFVDLGRRSPLEDLTGDDALFLGVAVDDDAEAEPRMTVGGALRSQWAALAANAQDVREADIQPRSVALAGTPTRLENGSLRLGAEANQVLTAASLATLTGGGNADALHTHAGQVASSGRFVGITNMAYTGDLGGPIGADLKCRVDFPDSHFCTYCEFYYSRPQALLAADAWIEPPPAVLADQSTGILGQCTPTAARAVSTMFMLGAFCGGWTSGQNIGSGSFVSTGGAYVGSTYNDGRVMCNVARPIACCAN